MMPVFFPRTTNVDVIKKKSTGKITTPEDKGIYVPDQQQSYTVMHIEILKLKIKTVL